MNSIENDKVKSIYSMLIIVFGIIPIAAGLDKFTNILVNWEIYVNPVLKDMLPVSTGTFMVVVGIIEIAAGILVLSKPRWGSIIVSAWLLLIAVSLIASGNYLDVAVRDIVMSAGAFTLFRLSAIADEKETLSQRNFAEAKLT